MLLTNFELKLVNNVFIFDQCYFLIMVGALNKLCVQSGNYYIRTWALWVFSRNAYGLLGITELWVMTAMPPRTNLVVGESYGLLESMGYHSYGLEES